MVGLFSNLAVLDFFVCDGLGLGVGFEVVVVGVASGIHKGSFVTGPDGTLVTTSGYPACSVERLAACLTVVVCRLPYGERSERNARRVLTQRELGFSSVACFCVGYVWLIIAGTG